MTTVTSKPTTFLDGTCARLLAAIIFAASLFLIVFVARAELFADQAQQKAGGIFPAFTSCRDAEYDTLAKMAAEDPAKWTAEAMVRAKQKINAMCIRKTASQSGAS